VGGGIAHLALPPCTDKWCACGRLPSVRRGGRVEAKQRTLCPADPVRTSVLKGVGGEGGYPLSLRLSPSCCAAWTKLYNSGTIVPGAVFGVHGACIAGTSPVQAAVFLLPGVRLPRWGRALSIHSTTTSRHCVGGRINSSGHSCAAGAIRRCAHPGHLCERLCRWRPEICAIWRCRMVRRCRCTLRTYTYTSTHNCGRN
jgi:hypothetical protein